MCFGNFSDSGALASSELQSTDDAVAILPDDNLPEPTPQPEPQPEPTPTLIRSEQQLDAAGGRVTTIGLENSAEIASVRVLNGPDHGNLTVNPDNTMALVLSGSDYSGTLSITVEINYLDGSIEEIDVTLNVAVPTQDEGWGQGHHYMLAEDTNGDVVIETGENHRAVYVTESQEGLTRSDIAALEGLTTADITKSWLLSHPEYGGDAEMALSTELGLEVWEAVTLGSQNGATSNWLLFENGYTYG